jgi:broad specificity phosphatase PhoE
MELIFIRHGHGEHNLNVPHRLSNENPRLTDKGKQQVGEAGCKVMPVNLLDLITIVYD